MAITFLYCFLFLLSLVVSPNLSSATTLDDVNDNVFLSSKTLKLQAESLIRGMNLSPKHDVNHMSKVSESRIVEKHIDLMGRGSDKMVQDLGHYAGYYHLPNSRDARMFYFFFKSRNNNAHAPVVIWLSGGPGCSSQFALFYENGPFHITDDMSLTWNDYGWDTVSNIIFVDQPTGTGFSYSSDHNDLRNNGDDVSEDLYYFIQAFFHEHPQYAYNDFYITGESYAGHYIPAFASRIRKGNKYNQGIHINLKGLAIGNGFTNPVVQYRASLEFALERRIIRGSHYNKISPYVSTCEYTAQNCNPHNITSCLNAYKACEVIHKKIIKASGLKNYYDIRMNTGYDFSKLEIFLNEESVKEALGVGNIKFVMCNNEVHTEMRPDWIRNYAVGIPKLLKDGIKLLVYAGEHDLICNWLGNERWVLQMEWPGQNDFQRAPAVRPFTVDGQDVGMERRHDPLRFIMVRNAGHMVPMDQPKVALEMLRQWMHTD